MEQLWIDQKDATNMNPAYPEYLVVDPKTASDRFDHLPSFGMYHDNYFITGIPLDRRITKHTADAKFQISIRQRLTKTVLPFNSFLMLTYTQKSFWEIYDKSAPFADSNYNPGLILGRPIITDNKLKGMAYIGMEHESNGKDSASSRSWNYFVLSGAYYFNYFFSTQVKAWPGFAGSDNKDIYKYRGWGLVALNYYSRKGGFWASLIVNPRGNFTTFNTQLELNVKLSPKSNQYIFLQWYEGYGESLLYYNKYSSMVRFGISIKPPLRNLY